MYRFSILVDAHELRGGHVSLRVRCDLLAHRGVEVDGVVQQRPDGIALADLILDQGAQHVLHQDVHLRFCAADHGNGQRQEQPEELVPTEIRESVSA